MSKQTAVEWLIEQCPRINTIASTELIKQAKEMEKEQIIFTYVSHCNTMNCQKTAKEKLKCSCGQYFWERNFK